MKTKQSRPENKVVQCQSGLKVKCGLRMGGETPKVVNPKPSDAL
jgi:hypothetical protein